MRVSRHLAAAALVLFAGACASVPFDQPKTHSTALTETGETALGRWAADLGSGADGESGFLLLADGADGDALCTRLFADHGVRAVPGSFFGVRSGVRVSYLLEEGQLARELDALADVIGAMR